MGFTAAFFYIFCISSIFCFNFDTNSAIVYTDPDGSLFNDSSSYFGYSVILHRDSQQENAWIQIGAPKATSSDLRNKPGRIFRCKIFGLCSLIAVDTTASPVGNKFRDKKDNAWIGGAMDIDERSGRSVVCGHRWINNQETDYWMEGVCFWSHLNNTSHEKLVPLSEYGKAIYTDPHSNTRLYNYAQGQAGFSVHMTNLKNASELLLGAPGVYNWGGTTLIYRDLDLDLLPVASRLGSKNYRQPVKRATIVAEFFDLNIANAFQNAQVASFGLFGYSLTSGYFFNENELLYVSGGPRSKNCVGQILLYTFAKTSDRALIVKVIKLGDQLGEYFGSALAAGDINQDGLDDLIVGAPFYTNSKYNEGRIFVFLGSAKGSLETPQQNPIIEGNAIGGQFGTSLMFLGDLHLDGYADVAVGSPYEDAGSGVVYIYRGNMQGLYSKPCQRIVGKSFIPNIRGFGISMSKPTDIDNNFYDDLAIGAYGSGHVVLLRSKPVVTLQQSLTSMVPRLDYNAKDFQVTACLWYLDKKVPPSINVIRKITVDELLHRAYLPTAMLNSTMITLEKQHPVCTTIDISIKKEISNRYDPITVSVSLELPIEHVPPKTFYAGQNNQGQQNDTFCKNCPVLNTYKSIKDQTIELSFALGCKDDKVCRTKLNLESKFLNIGTGNEYVLGSKDYLELEITISNSGEKAYSTQLAVELPKSVYFQSIPSNCLEQNSSSSIICNVENPLNENKQKTLNLNLDMKGVNSDKYIDALNFTLKVLTSSENLNPNKFIKTLNVIREADIALTGKTSQQSYSYGNITYGKPNFTQIYQVEKFGASSIDEVLLTIQIPTEMFGIKFLRLYTPEGSHAGQPINCQSNVKYILEEQVNIGLQLGPNDTTDAFLADVTTTQYPLLLKRSVREAEQIMSKHNEKLLAFESKSEFEYLSNRTFYINCTNSDVVCSYVNCSIGPFKAKQNMAVLAIKMLFDVQLLSEMLGTKDIIILSTDGFVTIKSPSNFSQSGRRPDAAVVSSVFIGESPESKIATWIIIVAVIAGLLLLLLLIMGLIKAGFFQRTKKMELEALKEAEEVEQFKRDSAHCEENEDMFQGVHKGESENEDLDNK